MNFLLSLFSKYKAIGSILGVLALVSSLYLGWHNIKSNIYDDGYAAAVQEYQAEMIKQRSQYDKEIEAKLIILRKNLQQEHLKEIERLSSDTTTNTDVQVVTKYIKEQVYVNKECDVVDPDLIGMFNQFTHNINNTR